jgi:hypothetical protein
MSNFYDEVCEYSYSTPVTENFDGGPFGVLDQMMKNLSKGAECKKNCEITSNPEFCYNDCMAPQPCSAKCDKFPKGTSESEDCYKGCEKS